MANRRKQSRCKRLRLSSMAKSIRLRLLPNCAIPGCSNHGAKHQCCKQPFCVVCQTRTLRTSRVERLRTRCPFCGQLLLRSDSIVKKLMRYAFQSHATTIECEGGPPVVLAHLPCPHGHYESRTSTVRLLPITQKQMLCSTEARLDLAEKKTLQLTQILAATRECQHRTLRARQKR